MELKVLKQEFEKFFSKLLKETKSYYKKRLITLSIFGSGGRGKMNYESDIDILIIAEKLPDGRMPRVREFDRIEKKLKRELNFLEKEGIHTRLSPIFKTPEEVKRGSPLFLDMIYDSKMLFDKNNFFAHYLNNFKKRLKKLGARRIVKGESWYWDLKPDYKKGEIFEI